MLIKVIGERGSGKTALLNDIKASLSHRYKFGGSDCTLNNDGSGTESMYATFKRPFQKPYRITFVGGEESDVWENDIIIHARNIKKAIEEAELELPDGASIEEVENIDY